jgi:hypothetical protein
MAGRDTAGAAKDALRRLIQRNSSGQGWRAVPECTPLRSDILPAPVKALPWSMLLALLAATGFGLLTL